VQMKLPIIPFFGKGRSDVDRLHFLIMNPKFRSGAFVGIAFALMVPYLAFVVYFSLRLPQNQWPSWFTNTIAVWFVATFVVLTFVARQMFKKQGAGEPRGALLNPTKTKLLVWIMRIVGSYLVLLWSVFFVIGVKGTIEGKYVLSRALTGGAFLLFFIGVFAWSIYRSFRKGD
jgi:protein-S-isoprenylcysteine O-methyltransferase Ste14